MAEDLYSILGVPRDATEEALKKAYRRIARENHPDVNPNNKAAEERFKRATAAFEVLGDAEKRRLYDEFGEDAARIGFDPKKADTLRAYRRAGGGAGGAPFGAGAADFDLGDLFGDLFGRAHGGGGGGGFGFDDLFGGAGRRAAQGPQRGEDLTARVQVSLAEAVGGAERAVALQRPGRCGTCAGTGRHGRPATCPACAGSGRGRGRALGGFGAPCQVCGGSGSAAPACTSCGGSGAVEEHKRLTVRIPPGVQSGSQVRVAGQGAAGLRGGPPGDLFIETEVQPHPAVRREGDDLAMDLPITVPEAVLGAEVRVPTFEGDVTVRVPPGSQSGRKLRLKGKGVPSLKGGGRGDLYLTLQVRVPEEDSPQVRAMVEALQRAYGRDVRADLKL
jgi:molecular chaperone DnaJ